MIKDFQTYINEGLFDRSQSEFSIGKTDKGIEQVYIPKNKNELYKYIDLDIEQAKKDGTYPDVNLNNIDVSGLGDDELRGLFGDNGYKHINPDISNWNIKYIPSSFFYNNKQIKEFTIPNNITSIGLGAFSGCSGLTSIYIPNSVTSIENGAFWGCSLTSVTIPNSITNIGDWMFFDCNSLTSIEIPNSVTSIGNSTFQGCTSLTSVEIPDSVTRISNYAFVNCSGLSSVIIPNSVTSIGDRAFLGCSGLTSVTIPQKCKITNMSFPENCKITRRDD